MNQSAHQLTTRQLDESDANLSVDESQDVYLIEEDQTRDKPTTGELHWPAGMEPLD